MVSATRPGPKDMAQPCWPCAALHDAVQHEHHGTRRHVAIVFSRRLSEAASAFEGSEGLVPSHPARCDRRDAPPTVQWKRNHWHRPISHRPQRIKSALRMAPGTLPDSTMSKPCRQCPSGSDHRCVRAQRRREKCQWKPWVRQSPAPRRSHRRRQEGQNFFEIVRLL